MKGRPSRLKRHIAVLAILAPLLSAPAGTAHAQSTGALRQFKPSSPRTADRTIRQSTIESDPLSSDAFRPLTPIRDLGGSARALGRDLWRTASAPFWMDRRAWVKTGAVVAVGGLLFLVDEDINRLALRNEDEPVFRQVLDTGTFFEPLGLMGNTNVWLAAAAVTSYAVGLDRPKRLFTELLYAQWIAGLTRNGVNRLVGRARPNVGRGSRRFAIGGGTSFPSGHASTVFQVAAVLSHHAASTPVSLVLYGLAGTVAWQRIADQQHWSSDVWLGAAYGWAVARLVIRLHEDDAIRLKPVSTPSGGLGLGLTIGF